MAPRRAGASMKLQGCARTFEEPALNKDGVLVRSEYEAQFGR